MPVNAKTIQGRRNLTFHSLDDVITDVETLVASPTTRTIGNWPLLKLITHLTQTIDGSIDGFTMKAPLVIRLVMPLFKGRFLKATKMKPGIILPKSNERAAFPEAASAQEALRDLRRAVERTRTESMAANHPAFGKMTNDEWNTVHLRHSEMHLSFALPE